VLEGRCLPSTVTNLNDAGAGSLRQAILDTPAGGTVDFQPGLSGTITLTSGELLIDKDLTISGPGADVLTVSGNNASRVFEVATSTTVNISGLTIANGFLGVDLAEGAGILNSGTLTITSSVLTGNSVAYSSASAYVFGGAIYNSGDLTVSGSTLSDNHASAGTSTFGGVASAQGGGIYSSGTLNVAGSLLSGNYTSATHSEFANVFSEGGAIYNLYSALIVTSSTVTGSSGTGSVYNDQGTVTVTGSTFSANPGGGILCGPSSGGVSVTSSTISGNTGFGIDAMNLVTVTSSTISGNTGAGLYVAAGPLVVRNTIVAGNTSATGSAADVSGSLTSQGHNLIGDGDGGSGYAATDLVGSADNLIDPKLGPLADNGGPTQTRALLSGSPAIAAGDPTNAPATDQRGPGYARTVGGTIDIGAFEVQTTQVFPVTTTNDSGTGSLRQAILEVNAHPGGDAITFSFPGSGVQTIAPTSPLPAVTVPVFVNASQPGVSGTPAVVLSGADAGAGADGLTLAGGNSTVRGLVVSGFAGAGIHLDVAGGDWVDRDFLGTDASGTQADGNGTGLFIDGTANNLVTGSLISGNTGAGVSLTGSHNLVLGNTIGANAARTARVSNGIGVAISGANNTVGGADSTELNVIAANLGDGVLLSAGATGNVLENNVIGRNRGNGVELAAGASGNALRDNFIGTTPSATLHLPNGLNGVLVAGANNTVGGTAAGAGNVIALNTRDGVLITGSAASGNLVQGNFIGTDRGGTLALGNLANGVELANASGNTVGGTVAGAGNTITNNALDGVLVDTGTGDAIRQNVIFANGALAIELRNHGNQDQAAPIPGFAYSGLGSTVVRGTFTGAPDTTFAVDLFASPDTGASEGEQLLGSLSVTTDASGQAAFRDILPGINLAASQLVTATATDPAGNTSQFSAGLAVTQTPVTTLGVPGAISTFPTGINDAGAIVGDYLDASGQQRGFLLSGGTYTTLDAPGATATFADGINDAGAIVGRYTDASAANHGFLLSGGSYTTLDVPGAIWTFAEGINAAGQIVGYYEAIAGYHGFLLSGGTYTTLDVPGATNTEAYGINDAGEIVGEYTGGASLYGFLLRGGTYTTLAVPGASSTEAFGINDAGQIVGRYDPAVGPSNGFVLVGGIYAVINIPGASSAEVDGINDVGQIVGTYSETSRSDGFVATKPSPPGALVGTVPSWLTPALANAREGSSVSPADATHAGPAFGADVAATWASADASSDPLSVYTADRTQSEGALSLPSLATLRQVRDAVFAALDDPVPDGLSGSL
jgi:parallel beta-helix repeat protein